MNVELRQWKRDEEGTWQPFPPRPDGNEAPGALDERHPHVGCAVCGVYAQVLPEREGDAGHWDDLRDDPSVLPFGDLSVLQRRIHDILGAWSQNHASTHSDEEHAALVEEKP